MCAMLGFAYRQTKGWRESNRLQANLLRWKIVFGMLAILAGLWMSQTQYPVEAIHAMIRS